MVSTVERSPAASPPPAFVDGGRTGDLVRALVASDTLQLADPGTGRTAERHLALFDTAREHPVSVARIVEAHFDAVAILHEAGRAPHPDAVYGVWASTGPDDVEVEDRCEATTDWSTRQTTMTGTKPFASGLGIVTRALVTARDARRGPSGAPMSPLLVDVDLRPSDSIVIELGDWSTPALADSATGRVRLAAHGIDDGDIVCPPRWYLDRVGFWHGACGPAACWAGAAAGVVDAAERLIDGSPHRRAHLGAMRSAVWSMHALLVAAGREIDEDPTDGRRARWRALSLRHSIERTATDVLDRFGRAFGPRPFVGDPDVTQRWLDTHLYLRQDHGERDLAALGEGPRLDGIDG